MIQIEDIVPLRGQSDDNAETERIKSHFAQTKRRRQPFFLTREEFEWILHWKLRTQYARGEHLRVNITDDLIKTVTQTAFAISNPNKELELKLRVPILTSLPGVAVPIASAILALVEPDSYAVLDFRGWNQVFPDQPKNLTISGYQRYMKVVMKFAQQLGWPTQEVDLAIWEFDRRASKKT
jgi:hypothetical protein